MKKRLKKIEGNYNFDENEELELKEGDLGETDELEFEEEDLDETDVLELEEEDLDETDELELEEEDLDEGDELELEEEDLDEGDELELEEEDDIFAESDDLELKNDDPDTNENFEMDNGKWKTTATKSRAKKSTDIQSETQNKGLAVNAHSTGDLKEKLEVFLKTDMNAFNVKGSGGTHLSIVKADSGTSIRLSKEATRKLNNPTKLSIGFRDSYLILCNASGLDVHMYKGNFKNGQTKIYNTSLVDEVIKEFKLDFTDKTSISFGTGYYKQQGRTVLYVKLV